MSPSSLVIKGDISHLIHTLRGQRVILDLDLARLYGVPTRSLNQAVKRNHDRFPEAFMFQLTKPEALTVRSQIVILEKGSHFRYLPHAFTEHGALMAANVLNSRQAITMSVRIVMAFVQLRRMVVSVEILSRKIETLERKFLHHDDHLKTIFKAIRQLMAPPEPPHKRIAGFGKPD